MSTFDGDSSGKQQSKPIPSAISAAIESNITLQAELQRRLLQIKHKKIQNRHNAAKLYASISNCCREEEIDVDGVLAKYPKVNVNSSRADNTDVGKTGTKSTKGDDVDNNMQIDSNGDKLNKKKTKKRKRTSPRASRSKDSTEMGGFFVDKDGCTPEILRSSILGRDKAKQSSMRMVFDKINQPPLSTKEEPKHTSTKKKTKGVKSNGLEEVAIRIDKYPSQQPPSSDDCIPQFTFADAKISKTKLTKQEGLFIMDMINKLSDVEKSSINWCDIAEKLNAKFHKQTSPWLCFQHYRSTLINPSTRVPPWTQDEDELLLKYLASQGPQYLLQGESIVQTCRNLFPNRTTQQITSRCQTTLVNPSLIHDNWSSDEKRKLALLMRVYSDEQNPTNLASRSVHFPNRAPKSVAEKWTVFVKPEGDDGLKRKRKRKHQSDK